MINGAVVEKRRRGHDMAMEFSGSQNVRFVDENE
jgi:hypothetical protein